MTICNHQRPSICFYARLAGPKKVPLKLEIDDYGCPDSVNVAKMTPEELWNSIKESYDQAMRGEVVDAKSAIDAIQRKYDIAETV